MQKNKTTIPSSDTKHYEICEAVGGRYDIIYNKITCYRDEVGSRLRRPK